MSAVVPTTLTAGHVAVRRIISDDIGLEVEDEVAVGTKSIDVYVRELHVGVEYDGKDFHTGPMKEKRDALRDEYIMSLSGIPLCRILEADLKKGKDYVMDKLVVFFEEWETSVEDRRAVAKSAGVWL